MSTSSIQNNEVPILTVRNLSTYFKTESGNQTYAVKGVSFELNKNEILGVVGESGSGKSITALSIMRLLPSKSANTSDESQIIYCNGDTCVDLLGLEENEMVSYRGAKIAMIFQEPMSSLNPTMTAGKQVLESVLLHSDQTKAEGKNTVLNLFTDVGLDQGDRIYNSYPHELSGGQIQRIMIAMALAGSPDILIADEPTTALDVTVQKEILALIKAIQANRKMSCIFISHDLAVINQICDRVMVMKKGQLVETGKTSSIFSNATHPYTRGLIASRPPEKLKLSRLPTVTDFLENSEHTREYYYDQWKLSDEEIGKRRKDLISSPVVLKVSDLSKAYKIKQGLFRKPKKFVALEDISFDLRKGEVLGVVGESGSGKSTLAKIICRLQTQSSGSVEFKDQDVFKLSGDELKGFRKNCQIIFQDPFSALNPRMKIGKAIAEPMEVQNMFDSKSRKERVMELLIQVGLEENHFDRYPHEFSGGQRQRIVIARALSLEPELLICDESVSALDVSVQAMILNLLQDLKAKHEMSYIFISHDLSVVKFISDRILVLNSGKLVEQGTAEEVYERPKQEYTRKLIDAIPRF